MYPSRQNHCDRVFSNRRRVQPPPVRSNERRSVRWALLVASAFACLLSALPSALADDVDSPTAAELRETAHRIHVTDREGVLVLEVEREVRNGDVVSHTLDLDVDLPRSASVHAFEVEQIDAEGDAAKVTGSLVTRAEGTAHNARVRAAERGLADPVALDANGLDAAIVRNLEVPPRGTALVRYEVWAPCNWNDGGCRLDVAGVPWIDGRPDAAAPTLDISGGNANARHPDDPLDAEARTWHHVRPVRAEGPDVDSPVTVRLASVPIDLENAAAAIEIDVASQISELPIAPRYVFVVDLSRSMGTGRLQAQLDTIDAMLAHSPDATADMVLFDRTARRLVGRLAAVDALTDAVARAERRGELELAHGSMLERALPLAADALAGEPGRVVIMTDRRMREIWDTERALEHLAGLHDDSIVHLVNPSPDGDGLYRDDDDDLAALASDHGGMCVDLDVPDDDTRAEATALSLVRPTRIDHLEIAVRSQGEADDTYFGSTPDALDEGDGYDDLHRLSGSPEDPPALPGRVVVSGSVWGERREWVAEPSQGFSDAIAARAVASGEFSLGGPEIERLATRVGFLSSETSFVIREPDRRALTWEMENTGFGFGFGSSSCGSSCALKSGHARLRPSVHMLADAYEACVRTHGLIDRPNVEIRLETTGPEIVDVAATSDHGVLATCLEEAAWRADVPADVASIWRFDWSESYPRTESEAEPPPTAPADTSDPAAPVML